jgi:hypothetical protein
MHRVVKPAALVAGFLIAFTAAPAQAAFYMFTNVADTTTAAPSGTFTSFGSNPAISGSTVSFTGFYSSGSSGVFSGNGGALTTIVKSGDPAPIGGTYTSLNNGGRSTTATAFRGDTPVAGIYFGSGGAVTPIAKNGDPAPSGTFNQGFSFSPSMSGNRVAFTASYTGGGAGVFSSAGGPLTTIAKIGDAAATGTFTDVGSIASVSGNSVAFVGSYGASQRGVFVGSGGPLSTIVKSGDPAPSGIFSNFANGISISGNTVAFNGTYTGGNGIFTGSGGSITTIAKSGDAAPVGTFSAFSVPAISNGNVAFVGLYSGGQYGLFSGNGGPLATVVKTGDSLFGSTLTNLSLSMFGLDPDSSGKVAFRYSLADDRSGIAIASAVVPEASPVLIWSVITLGALAYSGRRQIHQLVSSLARLRIAVPVAVIAFAVCNRPAYSAIVIVPFDTPGSVAAQTAAVGISTFVSNSFATTGGISGLFTGNPSAPIGPPSALSLGAIPGPATYFHFSPVPGYRINSIGISATGAFTGQSTTFRVFAANEDLNSIQYDAVMTPTGSGIAGLNGGAVFLSANSLPPGSPITAFRVWQLDDGYGVLDNLVADVALVPEASPLLIWTGIAGVAAFAAVVLRRRGRLCGLV